MDLGKPVMEPDLEAQSSSVGVPEMEPPTAPKIPKGGEI
jgi:hypothetical protein